jgi:hypothetical protein
MIGIEAGFHWVMCKGLNLKIGEIAAAAKN